MPRVSFSIDISQGGGVGNLLDTVDYYLLNRFTYNFMNLVFIVGVSLLWAFE